MTFKFTTGFPAGYTNIIIPQTDRRYRDFLPVLQPAPKCVRPEWLCFLRSADKTECYAHADTRRDSGCDNQETP